MTVIHPEGASDIAEENASAEASEDVQELQETAEEATETVEETAESVEESLEDIQEEAEEAEEAAEEAADASAEAARNALIATEATERLVAEMSNLGRELIAVRSLLGDLVIEEHTEDEPPMVQSQTNTEEKSEDVTENGGAKRVRRGARSPLRRRR